MRIGIDLHSVTDFMQGTRTYSINLVKQLLKLVVPTKQCKSIISTSYIS
jgi:hypothetical protein